MGKRVPPIVVALLFTCPAAWAQGPELIFQDGFDPPLVYPEGAPFRAYVIDGTAIYGGAVTSWQWTVTSDSPCHELLSTTTGSSTFTLTGTTAPTLTLRPSLSGDYTVDVAIVTDAGPTILRTFVVHIGGPGLRVEMCSDRTDTTEPGPPRPPFGGDHAVVHRRRLLLRQLRRVRAGPRQLGIRQ